MKAADPRQLFCAKIKFPAVRNWEFFEKKFGNFDFSKKFIKLKISDDKSYVEKMPKSPKSDKNWGSYSQKTVEIAGKIHG